MALSRKTVNRINEWVKWYNWHHDKIERQPLETQVRWLLKAQQGSLDLITQIAAELAGSRREDRSDGGILLPRSRW